MILVNLNCVTCIGYSLYDDALTVGLWAEIAQSVQQLATGWTVRGSNPGGDGIFCTCPDRPWGPPSLLYKGYRVFIGDKERPGREADPITPSNTFLKKE
jgi:hypothetical protein